jgi:hypothetical protein
MCRVLQFLQWKATVWEGRAGFLQHDLNAAEHSTRELVGSHLLLPSRIEGVRAYAHRQVYVQQKLYRHFKSLWCGVPLLVTSQLGRDNAPLAALDLHIVSDLSNAASFLE